MGLTIDDLLAIQLALNVEIEQQQLVLDCAGAGDALTDDILLAQKRLDNAAAALNKVMDLVEAEMDGSKVKVAETPPLQESSRPPSAADAGGA